MTLRIIISNAARRVLRVLKDHPDGEATLEELAKEARTSKTAAGHALHELEDAGITAVYEEEGS